MPLGASRLAYLAKTAAAPVGRTAVTVTANGNAQLDTAQYKFGGASALFDGTEDYLTFDSQPVPSSGDFTIELWFRPSSIGTLRPVWSMKDTGGTHRGTLYINAVGGLTWWLPGGNANASTFGNLSANTWYHVACVRNGTQCRIAVNGTMDSYTATTVVGDEIKIGKADYSGSVFGDEVAGHIDEIRISNTARYTSGFTAPTAPFVNDANTTLLVHCDGTDGNTVFSDDNGVRGRRDFFAVGDAQIDTAQSKFGGSSLYLDGNDYIEHKGSGLINESNNGTVTVEMWIRPAASVAYNGIFDGTPSTTGGIREYGGAGNLVAKVQQEATGASTGSWTAGTWSHFAVTFNNGTITTYRDGVQEDTGSYTSGIQDKGAFIIGAINRGGAGYFTGHIDEFRISNNIRYTSGFTAPTSAFTNDANTTLLLHFDGSDGSTTLIDDNS